MSGETITESVGGVGLPPSVEAILRAQPLNPFVRLEMKPLPESWSIVDPDKKQQAVGGRCDISN